MDNERVHVAMVNTQTFAIININNFVTLNDIFSLSVFLDIAYSM